MPQYTEIQESRARALAASLAGVSCSLQHGDAILLLEGQAPLAMNEATSERFLSNACGPEFLEKWRSFRDSLVARQVPLIIIVDDLAFVTADRIVSMSRGGDA